MLEGERGQDGGVRERGLVMYPVSRHVLLTGSLMRAMRPAMNFNYFASMNTMMLLRTDVQAYSHIPDFPWMDESG